ncbi:hypothetical protein LINPERPRIM_LOCUS38528 [Linum perenne]
MRIKGVLQLLETKYIMKSWGKMDMVIVVQLDLSFPFLLYI